MTFTILGRDAKTGELGIGIATYSLAVGATCPQILPGIAVMTTQASTNPTIAEEIMELIEDGYSPTDAFMQALANDEHPSFRQVALIEPTGQAIVHSGGDIKPFSGHRIGEHCVAVGNFLANENVLPTMVASFEKVGSETPLADRLLSALTAANTAGGQSSADGTFLPERSAALMVGTPGERFPIDVRVDASNNAIPELRQAYESYAEMHEFYLRRADDPTELPSQDAWVQERRGI